MPRRHRRTDYMEELDDEVEADIYPIRAKDEHIYEHDTRHGQRVPEGPFVEVLERRHIRDHSAPLFFHDKHHPSHDMGIKHNRSLTDAPPNNEAREYNTAIYREHKPRGRRRSRHIDIEEEEYYSHGGSSDRRYTDSDEFEEDDELVQRRGPSMPQHSHKSRKESTTRSRSLRGEKRDRRSENDQTSDVHTRHSELKRDYREPRVARKHTHFSAPANPPHKPHYPTDLTDDDEEDETDDEEDMPRSKLRHMRVPQPSIVKEKHLARRSREPSLSSSSLSSLSSSELEAHRAPSPPRPSAVPRDPATQYAAFPASYHISSQPPAPSPGPIPNERATRHRKSRKERLVKEEVLIEPQTKEVPILPLHHPPPEPYARRKKERATMASPTAALPEQEQKAIVMENERNGPRSSRKKIEIVEEDYYRRREPEPPSQSTTPAGTMDDWAIVKTPSETMDHIQEEIENQQLRHPRHREPRPRLTEDEERDSGKDISHSRGKVGRRYIGVKDRRERLWTEITKNLVVREAIERAGYEYDETDFFYYIFSYLSHDDVSALIQDSEDIRQARRRRIQEIHRERSSLPPAPRHPSIKSAPLPLEKPPPSPRHYPWEERRRGEWEEPTIEGSRWRARSGRW